VDSAATNLAGSGLINMRQVRHQGFTLVELLVVIAIIVILVAAFMAALPMAMQHAYSAGCLAHIRSLSIAFIELSGDNNGELPGRTTGTDTDKWPVLLLPYVQDPKAYTDPGDPIACAVPVQNLTSDAANNSSFFFNGFNDLGAYTDPTMAVHLVNLTNAPNLMLLGEKVHGNTQYYMDFVEGNENDILNKTAYFGGSDYGFADGSARFVLLKDYNNDMWLVNQNYQIP
jgi:prepilin-type N-terminal cleavage/methylation domain-containing protein